MSNGLLWLPYPGVRARMWIVLDADVVAALPWSRVDALVAI
jgi:hypothetical protein